MDDSIFSILMLFGWVSLLACEINGLYISFGQGFGQLLLAFFLPPLAMYKGLIGFIF